VRPQEHSLQFTLQELSTELEGARPGPRAPPRTLHPPVPSARCWSAHCQRPSPHTISPSNPEWGSCVPPRRCPALRAAPLMPEPQARLGWSSFNRFKPGGVFLPPALPGLQPAPLSPFPSCAATVGFFAAGQNRAAGCASTGQSGRLWEVDAAGRSRGKAAWPCPASHGAGGGGPGDLGRALLIFGADEGRQPRCLCLWDWRWSLVRRAVQAAGLLSAKTSVSTLHPCLGGQEAALPWVSTLVLFLCFRTPLAPQGLQYPPCSGQAPATLGGEGIQLVPCYTLARCSCGHRYGRAEGFVLQNGASRVPRPFAEEHPWGATELPAAASWGHHLSPVPVPRLPKSLESHQLLSKPCNGGPLGGGKEPWEATRWLICRERRKRHPVKRGRGDPNHATHFLRRVPPRWGNEALLGCSFYIFL